LEPLLDKVNKLNVLTPYSSRGGELTGYVRTLHGAIGKPDAHRSRRGKSFVERESVTPQHMIFQLNVQSTHWLVTPAFRSEACEEVTLVSSADDWREA
jgi:hypothetical protein